MSYWQKTLHEDSSGHTVFVRTFAEDHLGEAVLPTGITPFMGVGVFNVETAPGTFVQIQREFPIFANDLGGAFAGWNEAYKLCAPGIIEKARAEFASRGRR